MSNRWHKLGLLYCPAESNRHPKLLSHAANPLPVRLHGDVYRIYFSGRDAHNRSSVGAVDIDIIKKKITNEYYHPFFEHGPEGSFYADGVSIGNIYDVDGVQYMTFMGWQAPKNHHWRGDIGRLVVKTDLTLSLDSDKPFMESDILDPISLSYPWVMKISGSYHMWYPSVSSWDAGNGEMLAAINSAISSDGHNWHKQGLAIPYELGKAQAFSRPNVLVDLNGRYEMWFSYRSGSGQQYRIGYAIKKDEKGWELALDDTGINVSSHGWDSEMIEYPYVFDHKKERYMLYNGNGHGRTGFGLAILTYG